MEDMDTVRIFDTTLRDGEQSPGATLTRPEKLEIARLLESMGVDIIEAGFPISSNGDFEAVHAIASEIGNSVVCGLARSTPGDIDRAGEAVQPARRKRIHIFCATSKIHREHKLKKGKEQIIQISVESIKQAKQYTDDIEFSPEDASRTELDFLEEIVHAVVEAGATTVNLPDTVGYAMPKTYGEIFSHLLAKLPILKQKNVVLSCHCHNDLGLAVANSLSAIENGARQAECTINGIGERAGNAAMEEIVMSLRTRQDHFKTDTRIDATKIYSASRMVSTLTGLLVQRNKAIVGENAFAHEAGIHQDGILKKRETYEIMDPATIGIPKTSLVLGKHSGRHAFRERIGFLGYTLTDPQIESAFERFKDLADKKKEVFDEDIEALVDEQLELKEGLWELVGLQVTAGSNTIPTATVTLRDTNGQTVQMPSIPRSSA
jgi:2-isopropylmalate synthase